MDGVLSNLQFFPVELATLFKGVGVRDQGLELMHLKLAVSSLERD